MSIPDRDDQIAGFKTDLVGHEFGFRTRLPVVNLLRPALEVLDFLWGQKVTDNEISLLPEEGDLLVGNDHTEGYLDVISRLDYA